MTEDRTSGPEETGSPEPVSEGPPAETDTDETVESDEAVESEAVEGEVVDDQSAAEDDEPTEVRIRAEAPADASADDEDVTDEEVDVADADADAGADEEPTGSAKAKDDKVPAAIQRINELTDDVKRVQAEYANYRKRVDRDRDLVAQNAVYKVLSPIVDVLDTIDRAREHGEVEGGFKAVADQLEQIVSKLGLTRFGEPGDLFDPTRHEALSHMGTDADVEETTVKVVAKAGYLIGDRVVRAAQVLVVDPE